MVHQLGIRLILIALIALATACGSKTLPAPERGCQRFAELVDDVALSVSQPQRMLDRVSGESVHAVLGSPEFERRYGEGEAERSTRFALYLGRTSVVIALESMAMDLFHDDHQLSRPAYMLWKSAAVVESGAPSGLEHIDTELFAEKLVERCGDRGYQVPESEPRVILEYLD